MATGHKILFYALIFSACGYAIWRILGRVRLWMKGKPIDWKPQMVRNVRRVILEQRRVANARPKSGAPMHLLIFYGFMALLLATTLLAFNTYLPFKFLEGQLYLIYETVFDSLGLLLVIGAGWALIRRQAYRPKVMVHDFQDLWALLLLLMLGATGYILEAARISNSPKEWDGASWVGHGLARIMPGVGDGTYVGLWWLHALLVMAFIAGLPHMRLKHIALAVASAAGAPDRPMGQLVSIKMEEVEQTGKIGVEVATDFSRWHLLSLDACMECGRCTEVCPANGVGKSLDPRAVVQSVHRALTTEEGVAATVTEEALWACTTCNACVETCPVMIRHTDLIVDARRSLVAEGRLSGTAATVLRQTGSTGNAWGAAASQREDWMRGLEVPLARDKKKFDVLFWVGCAGATDPGAIKTTKAMAELLNKSGMDYACLGSEEACTGDPARRIGDEFLFQEQAAGNVATFAQYEFKTIVTACPHCFNSLSHEYPEFGGKYRVLHHSQLLAELIAAGKLKAAQPLKGEVTYHDPCYLARVNSECDAPRAALGEKTNLNGDTPLLIQMISDQPGGRAVAEPESYGKKTLCCGAGGGRMWMDDEPTQRPANRRAEQLVATGAKTVAVSCPFCRIMLESGLQSESDCAMNLVDLAELVRDANA